VDLSELFGIPTKNPDTSLNPLAFIFGGVVVLGYFSLGVICWLWKKNSGLMKKLGPVRYSVTALLFLCMMSLPIKMVLRIALNVKYVWVTPWFNI